MRFLIPLLSLLLLTPLVAKPRMETLADIAVGKPLPAGLSEKLRKSNAMAAGQAAFLSKLPEYQKIAGQPCAILLTLNGGNVASISITFRMPKAKRAGIYAWVKEQINVDPVEYDDGRFSYSEDRPNGYMRSLSLGTNAVGQSDQEYMVSISDQKVR